MPKDNLNIGRPTVGSSRMISCSENLHEFARHVEERFAEKNTAGTVSRLGSRLGTGACSTTDRAFMSAGQRFRPKNPGTYGRGQHKQSNWFKYSQIIGPLLPIPVGSYLLYKAICSFNRNPPPIATDSATVMARPLYGEPVYQRISFAPSTIARNMTARGEGR